MSDTPRGLPPWPTVRGGSAGINSAEFYTCPTPGSETTMIPGDPLTGTLPATKLIIPQAVLGPTRKPKPPTWPQRPDPAPITLNQLAPGRIAYIRTRAGIRRRRIRTINISYEHTPNRGRHYITAHNRRGLCHSWWVDRIVRIT